MNANRDISIPKSPLALTSSTFGVKGTVNSLPGGYACLQILDVRFNVKLCQSESTEESLEGGHSDGLLGDDARAFDRCGYKVSPLCTD